MSGRPVPAAALTLLVVLCGCPRGQQAVEPPDLPLSDAEVPAGSDTDAGPATPGTPRPILTWLGPGGELMLYEWDAGEASVALTGIDWTRGGPAWNESGSVVAFAAEDGALKRADLATGTVQVIGALDGDLPGALAVSPDGAKVAWVAGGTLSIWAGGQPMVLSAINHATTPSWSPDSARIAVGTMGADESEDGGLWIVDEALQAKQIVPASDGWGATQGIEWSPDGEWLAWSRGAGDGWTGDLARSDGNDLRRDAIGAGPIAWFPDSAAILVSVHLEACAFMAGIYDVDSGSLTQIGPEDWTSEAALSPDGSKVFAWGYDGDALLFDTVTGDETAWPEDLPISRAAWAPDGRLALILDSGDDGTAIWIGSAAGDLEEAGAAPVEAPWTVRWIILPPDAAALKGPLGE